MEITIGSDSPEFGQMVASDQKVLPLSALMEEGNGIRVAYSEALTNGTPNVPPFPRYDADNSNGEFPARQHPSVALDGLEQSTIPQIEDSIRTSFGANLGKLPLPRLERFVARHHLLNEDILVMCYKFWTVLLSKSLQSGLTIVKGGVDVEEDPEEGTAQVVLRVYVRASPAQAMAFWDSLDIELERWIGRLSRRERQMIMSRIGLRIHW